MKTFCIFCTLLLLCNLSYSQTWQWTHPEPNDNAGGWDYNHKVINDANGNIYQLGLYNNDLYLDGIVRATGTGSFVAKYNPSGKLLWYKLINRISTNYNSRISAGDIVISNNKLFLTGTYNPLITNADPCQSSGYYSYKIGDYSFAASPGDIGMFFSALDLNGNMLWTKTGNAYRKTTTCYSGVSVNYPPLLTTDKNNNVIVTFSCITRDGSGFTFGGDPIADGYYTNPYGCNNVVVIKYTNAGKLVWSNYAAEETQPGYSSNSTITKSVVADNNGNVFINCQLNDNTHFNTITYHTTSNHGYYQNNHVPHFSTSVLVKIAASGAWSFVKEIASVTSELDSYRNQNVAVDATNNLYLTVKVTVNCSDCGPGIILGDTLPADQSKPTMYLVKLNNNGSLKWKKVFGSGYDEAPNGFAIANNKLYLSGTLRNYEANNFLFSNLFVPPGACGYATRQDFIAQADTSGNFKWVTLACGNSIVFNKSLCIYSGNIYAAGEYRNTVSNLGNLNSKAPVSATSLFLGKIRDQYIHVGAISPLQVCAGSSVKVPFTSFGLNFSATNTFTAELSDAGGKFTSPTAIGSVAATGSGAITGTIPNTVQYGSTYRIRIKSSDTLKTGLPYYAYADVPYAVTITCPAPYAGFVATNITATAATLNWNTVPCGDFYYVQYRKKGTTAWTTVNNASNTGTITISGLIANTIYQWKVATKCTNNGSPVVSAYSAIKQFTTAAAFTAVSNGMVISEGASIHINPNPVRNIATVAYEATRSGTYTLQVTDVTGKVLLTRQETTIRGRNIISVDVSRFVQGMYLVSMLDEKGKQTLKMLKE